MTQEQEIVEYPVATNGLWERLPPELLRAIVEASSCPLHVYLQLVGLSHAIREGLRGTLRELSIVPDPALALITADALAAILGPCKRLEKLTFDADAAGRGAFDPHKYWCVATLGWVDEAFGGHTQLAALLMPSTPRCELVVERILSHLPGLVELTLSYGLPANTNLLQAISHSCPGLQVLRCHFLDDRAATDFAALAPLSGVLKELQFWGVTKSESSLAAFVGSLSALTSLELPTRVHCPLEPIASHLTSLRMPNPPLVEGLCRLEALSIWGCPSLAPVTRLLAANRATLRRLSVSVTRLSPEEVQSLMASLCALPHLTDLSLEAPALPPPVLVDRLEHLYIHFVGDLAHVRLASSRLQQLDATFLQATSRLEVSCPALVGLNLTRCTHPCPTVLHCPRLRTLRMVARNLDGSVVAPMPDLEVVEAHGIHEIVWEDPAWLLAGSSAPRRLRELNGNGIHLTRPDLLAGLCACGSLVRLAWLRLDVTRFPTHPLVLRLPGQLTHIRLVIEKKGDCANVGRDVDDEDEDEEEEDDDDGRPVALDLQVEAPGLLDFHLTIEGSLPSARVRLLNCRHLVRLRLWTYGPAALQVDEDAMQPRCICLEGPLKMAGLLSLLTRHGARLREVTIVRSFPAADYALRMMEALSGLPRLTSLLLSLAQAWGAVSLACPQLRQLTLFEFGDVSEVALACPLLERLKGVRNMRRRVFFDLPSPNLQSNDYDDDDE
ncbi:hypothetical protein PAPYR_10737 [Paratrimastix pyriformis]|uniref:Uncharacterized protein n=1 Tax=Paratrimastix pyriformis TaxID=342808 RepID=A0ABQ8U9H7_9EUKA|nr:hypothetical protein PAPYR_10737 [Paratrimastix pyriformis]